MKNKIKICIDFDGTICQKQSKKQISKKLYGTGIIREKPQDNAVEVINELHKQYEIIIFTTRANPDIPGDSELKLKRVASWLKKYNIKYDSISANKPIALAYIDDKGLRFTNWCDMSNHFIQ